MHLLGRELELATTDDAVEQAAAGAGRVLGVFGEAGIGKSALMAAMRDRATAAGMLVLEGRAAEHERSVPFGLAVDALDDHVATLHPRRIQSVGPDLAAVLPSAAAAHAEATADPAPGAAERFRYHRAVRSLLELLGRERPVALLLDDLHWADDASVELVLHLLRRPPRGPHLLAFAMRPQDPAARLLDAARSAPGFAHLEPGPLPDDAARELVAAIPDAALRERVVQEAGGNPLFLEELRRVARYPVEALPPTLMAAVGLEIAALPDGARALIEGAAVAGDPFDPDVAAAAADAGADGVTGALDRLVAADLIRPTGQGRTFMFRHPLVRRAVYDATPPGWRLTAHERTADALAERGAGAVVRAHHVERYARQGDLAAVALLAEAAGAAADTAPATAARRYAAALGLLPDADIERRAALLAPLALAQAATGRLAEARDSLDQVLALLPGEPTPWRNRLVGAAGALEGMMGRPSEMRRRVLAALDVTPPEHCALFELTLAYGCYSIVDFAGMREWSGRAIAHATADEVTIRLAAEALNGFAAIHLGEPELGRPAIESAVAQLATVEDATLAARIDDAWLITVACLLGELPELGLPVATRAIDIARATRQDRVIPMLAAIRSMLYEHCLRMDESLHDVEAATEAARLLGSPGQLHQALMGRSIVLWLRGDRAEAAQAREECLEVAGTLERSTMVITSLCNAAVPLVDEDPARCMREMTAAAGPLLERVDRTWSTWLLGMLVRAAISLDQLDDADRLAQRIEEHATLTQAPGALARAAVARAELLLARGEPAEAARLALGAADASEAGGMRLDAIVGRLTAGRALGAAGERQEAIAMLQRVAADAGRGSAGLFVEAAGRELRKLGTRVSATSRRAAAPSDASLSDREQAIADLVAEGRTNKRSPPPSSSPRRRSSTTSRGSTASSACARASSSPPGSAGSPPHHPSSRHPLERPTPAAQRMPCMIMVMESCSA